MKQLNKKGFAKVSLVLALVLVFSVTMSSKVFAKNIAETFWDSIVDIVLDSITGDEDFGHILLIGSYWDTGYTSRSEPELLTLSFEGEYVSLYADLADPDDDPMGITAHIIGVDEDNLNVNYELSFLTDADIYTYEMSLPTGTYKVFFDTGNKQIGDSYLFVSTTQY